MDKTQALDQLKFDIDMLLFDPMTGEDIHPSCLNEMNRNAYECDLFCIDLIKKYEILEKAFEIATGTSKKQYFVILGRGNKRERFKELCLEEARKEVENGK